MNGALNLLTSNEAIKSLIRLGMLIGLGGLLLSIGSQFNQYIPFEMLTIFFAIIRRTAELFSFIWDIDTLWLLVGYAFVIQVLKATLKAFMAILNFFKND